MASIANRAGPTRMWKTIKGKKVKTNDGREIGEIKKISETHLLLEEGKVHKHRFWIPKYVADAFDGKVLWLVLSEEEARARYQYGKEPPTQENYASEFEHFRKTSHGQKIGPASDFNENIRVVENYSNIRDLEGTAHTEIQEPVKQEIDVPRKVDVQKEKEKIIKDTGMSNKESSQSTDTKHYSKQF